MSWIYKNKPFTEIPEGYVGFTYKITCINKSNEYFGWTYFGMKNFFSTTTIKLSKKELSLITDKRLKKTKKETKESNWRVYNSSNKFLQDLIKKNPTHFKKEIVDFAKTKKLMSYMELELLVKNDVLRDNKNFNGNILSKFFKRDLIC